METLEVPNYKHKSDLFKFLIDNKDTLIAQKKSITKEADGILFLNTFFNKEKAIKANEPIDLNADSLKVRAIINTTNYYDSHMDVHIPGLWKKTLKENKMIMHIQEHKSREFDKIISEGNLLKSYTKNYSWKELGYNWDGETEALVFDSVIKETGKKPRNPFMFEQYANGYVKNHSVGMRYVKLVMCVNDESYGAEYEAWEKYYPMIVNPDEVDKRGYFWAVTEGKVIEGSAVPIGSNIITPTLDNNIKNEPSYDTHKQNNEPQKSTHIDYEYLRKNLKIN